MLSGYARNSFVNAFLGGFLMGHLANGDVSHSARKEDAGGDNDGFQCGVHDGFPPG